MLTRTMKTGERTTRVAAALLALSMAMALGTGRAEAGSTAAQVSFTHGVLAFETGDHDEAARLFEEAVRHAPDEGTFLHWLGLANLRLGRPADAVARLEESLKARRPPLAGRARVKEDLRLARAALAGEAVTVEEPPYRPEVLRFGELPRWEGWIGLESGWDSNPELVTDDRPFLLPGETVPGDVPSDAAAYLDAAAALRPFSDRQGWSLELGLSGHQSKYQDLDDLDLTMLEGVSSLSWGGDPRGALEGPLGLVRVPAGQGRFGLLVQAGGSRAWLSGDLYRSSADAAASLFFRETPMTTTRIAVTYSDRTFADGGLTLLRPSGEELSGSVDQWIFLGRPDLSLRLGGAVGRYDADRLFERDFWEVRAEAEVPLAPRWALYLQGSFRDDDFANPASNLTRLGNPLAPPRQDTTWRAAATAAWSATDRLFWSLRVSHVQRESNVEVSFLDAPLLDYERTILSLGVEWLF